jgi:hypothetical protein
MYKTQKIIWRDMTGYVGGLVFGAAAAWACVCALTLTKQGSGKACCKTIID